MSRLTLDRVTVAYDATVAVREVSLDVADGEIVALLGPSGCGKSTLLRAIGGLEPLVSGAVAIDGADVTNVAPHRRDVGLMFQDHVLFPHRTVADNVAFGPRMHGMSRHATQQRVTEALALVDLADAAPRSVSELSGGEQQRVALARAIAPRPRVLMLDEPLGALDRALRTRLLDELPTLLRTLGTTVVYVTHDQDEALGLADRIAVMDEGRFRQVASPEDVWRRPADRFVADFVGLDQQLAARPIAGKIATAIGTFATPHLEAVTATAGWLVCLPEAWRLADGRVDSRSPHFEGTVIGRQFAGDHLRARIALDAADITVRVPVAHIGAPTIGERARVAFDPSATWFVSDDAT
ncbi:MAG: ABC transporter ATP-binding protein [Nitriliruptoraceae bacterium]